MLWIKHFLKRKNCDKDVSNEKVAMFTVQIQKQEQLHILPFIL